MVKQRALLGLFVMIAACCPLPAAALLPTSPTTIDDISPLMITSFLTSNKATDIAYIEVYNNGNSPVRLSDWSIIDTTNARDVMADSTSIDGLIEPKTHVVLARPNMVANASYTITGWSSLVTAPKAMTNIQLIAPHYRPVDVPITSKSIDVPMTRSYLTSGYSSVTFEASYRQLYDDGLYTVPSAPDGIKIIEVYPYASDCSPFDESPLCGDYVKLTNTSTSPIGLEGLVLRTDSNSASRTSSNTISLSGELESGGYRTISMTDDGSRLSLTNSGGYVWLEDLWGLARYDETLAHYASAGVAQQGYSYALDRISGTWQWSTTPRPDGANQITAPSVAANTASCPEGKYLNPETNRCRTIADAVNALATCEEGYERNPTTNRCRKITPSTGSNLTPCSEGQERNHVTNRCRSIASALAELLPCDEGYERNAATNRCRKIKTTDMPVAAYPVKSVGSSPQTSATWWAIGGVGVLALAYAGWEWHSEIGQYFRRLVTLVRK